MRRASAKEKERMDEEEGMEVLDSALSLINWRLKPSSKRRLQLDMMALSTRLRPVVMVDYGGIMPQLQHHLSHLLQLIHKESPIFEHIRVMVIQDMIYLIHLLELAEYVKSSFNNEIPLLFVDLQHEPPKMVTNIEESPLALQLVSIQKLFLTLFPTSPPQEGTSNNDPAPTNDSKCVDDDADLARYSSAVKLEIEKFDGRINFGLWQVQVKDVLIQSGRWLKNFQEKPIWKLHHEFSARFRSVPRRNSWSGLIPSEYTFMVEYDSSLNYDCRYRQWQQRIVGVDNGS
ncbi:hypothetical protein AHAS_Ahas18G0026700 [Arachis hypogaea]